LWFATDSKSNDIQSILLVHNKYKQLGNNYFDPVLSLKNRVLIQFARELPHFRRDFLGGDNFVRGYSPVPEENSPKISDRIEVNHVIYHSVELQQTLLAKKDHKRVEAGIDFLFFVDFGYGSKDLKNIRIADGLVGYGFGFRIFASSLGVAAIDFGFNPYKGGYRIHLRDQ